VGAGPVLPAACWAGGCVRARACVFPHGALRAAGPVFFAAGWVYVCV